MDNGHGDGGFQWFLHDGDLVHLNEDILAVCTSLTSVGCVVFGTSSG
jgi:hypothetical protein